MKYIVTYHVDTHLQVASGAIVHDNYVDSYQSLLSFINKFAYEWTITTRKDIILTNSDNWTIEHWQPLGAGRFLEWTATYKDLDEWDEIQIKMQPMELSTLYEIKF